MMSMYRDSSGKTVVDIKDCDTMREVKILRMENLGLTEFDTQLFNQLANLEEMDISRNLVDNIPAVIRLPRLRLLNCSHNRLNGLNFVKQFPQLEEIVVVGNNLSFADFCIAAYLCPKLRSIDGQEIECLELNRMIESRMKPQIHKIWTERMQTVYDHSMTDAQFQAFGQKFLKLVHAGSKPISKTIAKFLNFRVDSMVDEFLSRIRKEEEVIEFCGSVQTVKRNYTKKRKKVSSSSSTTEDVDANKPPPQSIIVGPMSAGRPQPSAEQDKSYAHDDPEELSAERRRLERGMVESAVVVAVADEQGNGVVSTEHAAALIGAEPKLRDGSSVTIFVENVDRRTVELPEAVPATTTSPSPTTTPPPLSHTVRDASTNNNNNNNLTPPAKDFIDEECERARGRLQFPEREAIAATDRTIRRTATSSSGSNGGGGAGGGPTTKVNVGNSSDVVVVAAAAADKQQKVVRYWMYDDETSKNKLPPAIQCAGAGAGNSNNAELNSNNCSGNAAGKGAATATATTTVPKSSGKKAKSTRPNHELIALMKSKGMLPETRRFKVPVIDALQAAQLIVKIKTAPMVLYRGRVSRHRSNEPRAARVRSPRVTFKTTETTSRLPTSPPPPPPPTEELDDQGEIISCPITDKDKSEQHYFYVPPSPLPSNGPSGLSSSAATSPVIKAAAATATMATATTTATTTTTTMPQPIGAAETGIPVSRNEVDVPELANGLSRPIKESSTATTILTTALKERSSKSKINDSCFPPKKRVRFIDAFKDPVT